jgi:hypothetical protein
MRAGARDTHPNVLDPTISFVPATDLPSRLRYSRAGRLNYAASAGLRKVPRGVLTEAGRAAIKRKEEAYVKAGVRGPPHAQKMGRSFLGG